MPEEMIEEKKVLDASNIAKVANVEVKVQKQRCQGKIKGTVLTD